MILPSVGQLDTAIFVVEFNSVELSMMPSYSRLRSQYGDPQKYVVEKMEEKSLQKMYMLKVSKMLFIRTWRSAYFKIKKFDWFLVSLATSTRMRWRTAKLKRSSFISFARECYRLLFLVVRYSCRCYLPAVKQTRRYCITWAHKLSSRIKFIFTPWLWWTESLGSRSWKSLKRDE